jgi:hypothetical protein
MNLKQQKFKISHSQLEKIIDEWILNERNRKILKRKLLDEITFDNLAEESELSVRQTQYIVHDGREEIKKHIKKNLTDS